MPTRTARATAGTAPMEPDPDIGRSARKRRDIIAAATTLFLRDGYRSTSMDQVAADAGVSKQTVYKHFADKEQLFRGVVLGVTANSEAIVTEMTAALHRTGIDTVSSLQKVLTELARRYLDGVLQPHVLALRRLIIAEAEQFPDLARAYYEQAPARGIEVIAAVFDEYAKRGLLAFGASHVAAAHFAYLALAIPQDRAQFCPHDLPSARERHRHAEEAVRIFLAAYGG